MSDNYGTKLLKLADDDSTFIISSDSSYFSTSSQKKYINVANKHLRTIAHKSLSEREILGMETDDEGQILTVITRSDCGKYLEIDSYDRTSPRLKQLDKNYLVDLVGGSIDMCRFSLDDGMLYITTVGDDNVILFIRLNLDNGNLERHKLFNFRDSTVRVKDFSLLVSNNNSFLSLKMVVDDKKISTYREFMVSFKSTDDKLVSDINVSQLPDVNGFLNSILSYEQDEKILNILVENGDRFKLVKLHVDDVVENSKAIEDVMCFDITDKSDEVVMYTIASKHPMYVCTPDSMTNDDKYSPCNGLYRDNNRSNRLLLTKVVKPPRRWKVWLSKTVIKLFHSYIP